MLANALGAKPPRHFPVWLARLFAGEGAVMIGTDARGASNAKAKRELGWTLRYPSWRQGFAEVYAEPRGRSGRPGRLRAVKSDLHVSRHDRASDDRFGPCQSLAAASGCSREPPWPDEACLLDSLTW